MIVADASVVIKWFIKEELHDEARILLPYADRIVAPDFMLVECANIIWAKERRGLITRQQASDILPVLRRSGIRTEASLSLLDEALALAAAFDHPIYDCLYIATMVRFDARLVTWDKRLATKLASSYLASRAYLLSDIERLMDDLSVDDKK